MRDLLDRFGTADRELIVAGRAAGFTRDHDHPGGMIGRAAGEEIWPRILQWLHQQERRTTEAVTDASEPQQPQTGAEPQPGAGRPGEPGRPTPHELVFREEFEARIFPDIQREAVERGIEARDAERFGFLSLAADAVRSFVPPEAPPEALDQYRALLYHAFNFWRYGKRVYLLDPPLTRYLVEAAPSLESWELDLPYPSIYMQLPRNLFWGSISPDSTPEAVDGFFVTATDGSDALGKPYRRLEVLVVLGIRRDRAGFSVIPFSTEAGPGIVQEWAAAEGRESGRDFDNILPGGEIRGLYAILTSTEALKLVARALWYTLSFPGDVELETAVGRPGDEGSDSPPRPRLPYHRVRLGVGREGQGSDE